MKYQEDVEQSALFRWASFHQLPAADDVEPGAMLADIRKNETGYLYAIPNGGKRNAREGGRLKKQGVKAGVYDMKLDLARGGYFGLDIELKIGKNKPSEHQVRWGKRMTRAGRLAVVCYGWLECKETIIKYLKESQTLPFVTTGSKYV